MSESFSEWLKKNRFDFDAYTDVSETGIEISKEPCEDGENVSVRALGEWAWEELHIEIAIACLGEAEVKKRLEAVEK